MSHTPGPWTVEQEFTYGPTSIVAADGSSLMCSESYYPSVPSNEDDWSLIAAAPELLGAMTYLLEVIDKAGLGNLMHGVQLGQTSWYVKATDAMDACKLAIAKATGGAQ